MQKGIYIYCFIEGKIEESVDIMGIGKHGKVHFITHDKITVAVSDTPYKIYDPTKENAMAHEKVIQQLMKSYNLVPCNFGNVFKLKEDIITFIKDAYSQIEDNLKKVKDKMEVGLRVFWRKSTFPDEIETKDIINLRNEIQKGTDAEAYYSKIELGKLVEKQVDSRREYYSTHIFEPLVKNSVDAKLNETINPRMILNAAFLIWNSQEQQFDKLVEEIAKKYEDRLDFSYTGPWPPYNFANIEPSESN